MSADKGYQYCFVIVDAFTKFVWVYVTKTVTAQETLQYLEKHSFIFGNPQRIVSDNGAAFKANVFKEYCDERNIEHSVITTGVPRANGQVERINEILIPMITKFSIGNLSKWFRHVPKIQMFLNSSYQRSIGMSPFKLLIGRDMRLPEDLQLKKIIEEEIINKFMGDRDKLRADARANIAKIQEENKRTYNKKRKAPQTYKIGELVAIRRTQFGPRLKLRIKFFGPYKITKAKSNDRYEVEKVGECEGPIKTTTSCDNIKPWIGQYDEELLSGAEDSDQDSRNVGMCVNATECNMNMNADTTGYSLWRRDTKENELVSDEYS